MPSGCSPELASMSSGSLAEDAFARWRAAMLDALASPDRILAWQDRRYLFAHQVGQLLTAAPPSGGAAVDGHVVYGVYVGDGVLLYVGQTRDAKRRLRDLPVGESHHLAMTVPPETWERVIVVQWPRLLAHIPESEARAAERLGHDVCGLAIEHLLQVTYRPVMAARRRSSAGNWSERRIELSRSRGAISSSQFTGLFGAVRAVWDRLAGIPCPADGQSVIHAQGGRAVFPRALP